MDRFQLGSTHRKGTVILTLTAAEIRSLLDVDLLALDVSDLALDTGSYNLLWPPGLRFPVDTICLMNADDEGQWRRLLREHYTVESPKTPSRCRPAGGGRGR